MTYDIRLNQPWIGKSWRRVIVKIIQGLFGCVLFLFAVAWTIMLGSYSPYDPGVFNLNPSEGVSNLFGQTGALIASRFIVVCGLGSWVISAYTLVWATRFSFYSHTERFLQSLILLPILLVASSTFVSTFEPFNWWNHQFGLGGLFGDTVNGVLLNLLFFIEETYLAFSGLSFGIIVLVTGFYTFGFSFRELLHAVFFKTSSIEKVNTPTRTRIPEETQGTRNDKKGTFLGKFRKQINQFTEAKEDSSETDYYEILSGESGTKNSQVKSPGLLRRSISSIWQLLEEKEPELREKKHYGIQFQSSDLSSERTEFDDSQESFTINDPNDYALQENPKVETGITKPVKKSRGAKKDSQQTFLEESQEEEEYKNPPLSLLNDPGEIFKNLKSQSELMESGEKLKQILNEFSVKGTVERILQGPVITQYKFRPAPGIKTSRVIQLSDDIARLMSAYSARVTTIPGEPYVGIELPADKRETIYLKELAQSSTFWDSNYTLPLIMGKDISGLPIVSDLSKMPHLLIAGTTGSGKSVGLNSMILSLLYKLSPEQCKILMIDPKMIELSGYDGIPHLISPVVTDPKKALVALKWVVREMNRRYEKMQNMRWNIKELRTYNNHVQALKDKGEKYHTIKIRTGFNKETNHPVFTEQSFEVEETLPHIVVIIDELADLKQTAGKEIDENLQLISAKARASGIHLIAATQRPSVDVINGVIKSNFPNRVSFQVSSKIDSRTILNSQGAEHLLGKGDMLYLSGGGRLQRLHGPYVSDEEVENVVSYLKEAYGDQIYEQDIFDNLEGDSSTSNGTFNDGYGDNSKDDDLYSQAVEIVRNDRRISISYIQRKLSIGYNKAATIVERLEEEKIVSPANNSGKREIYLPK